MLDYCWDDTVLILFKRILRNLYNKYPVLVATYAYAYRDMWDNDDIDADVMKERLSQSGHDE